MLGSRIGKRENRHLASVEPEETVSVVKGLVGWYVPMSTCWLATVMLNSPQKSDADPNTNRSYLIIVYSDHAMTEISETAEKRWAA